MEIPEQNRIRVFKLLSLLLIILAAYFAVRIVGEIKKDSLIGESATPATIEFSGHGEVSAVPDIANVSFTITKDAKAVKDAQAAVAVVEKQALDLLKSKGVADKDIKANNASFYPKYEYQNPVCPQPYQGLGQGGISTGIYCPPGKQVLTGYSATESINVKVRNTDSVGDIMQALGTIGVTELSGPNFSIENEDALKEQARKLAILDAKKKAESLSKDLGVELVHIVNFSATPNTYPITYMAQGMAKSAAPQAPAPAEIPTGENRISSDVTITYEIR